MNAALAPVLRLLMQDIAARVERRVFRAPEDAAGMRIAWRKVVAHDAVVASKHRPVVIPVNRHRKRVADEGTQCDAFEFFVRGKGLHAVVMRRLGVGSPTAVRSGLLGT